MALHAVIMRPVNPRLRGLPLPINCAAYKDMRKMTMRVPVGKVLRLHAILHSKRESRG